VRIWKALTWEFLSHAVHLAYAAVLVPIIVPWLGWALTGFVEMSADGQVHAGFSFYFSYVGIAFFFCGAAAGARLVEMPKFGRLHPVSSELLATFFWLAPPCLIMLFNVISQMGYRIVSGSIWPILTTTVCLETFSTLTSLPDAPTALLDMERTRNRRIVRRLASAIVGLFALLSVFASRSGRNDFEGILVLLSVSSGYVGFAAGAWLGGRNMGIQIG
jgi:hypothetical protein